MSYLSAPGSLPPPWDRYYQQQQQQQQQWRGRLGSGGSQALSLIHISQGIVR